jgi:uncharacterized protein YkwD
MGQDQLFFPQPVAQQAVDDNVLRRFSLDDSEPPSSNRKISRQWGIRPVIPFGECLMSTRLFVPPLVLALCGLALGQEADSTDKVRESVHKAVNELRADGKVAPLKRNAKLDAAAQKHAENMARQQKQEHELDGKTVKDRILAEGYKMSGAGENIIAVRQIKNAGEAAIVAVKAWKDSPVHLQHIMRKLVTETGVGMAQDKDGYWYFCQVFAVPRK